MKMELVPKILLLLILCLNIKINLAENSLITDLEDNIQNVLSECTNYVTKWLEEFNDRHLRRSEIGKMLGYDDLKPKFGTIRESRSMKKMSMAMIPLIFQVGATSTWMILTSIMAVKSVAIGFVLLVFKIAVSSAKVASFFTSLKAKTNHQPEWSWSPHFEHHGQVRSLTDVGSYFPSTWDSYALEENEMSGPSYKTIPTHEEQYEEMEFKSDAKREQIGSS